MPIIARENQCGSTKFVRVREVAIAFLGATFNLTAGTSRIWHDKNDNFELRIIRAREVFKPGGKGCLHEIQEGRGASTKARREGVPPRKPGGKGCLHESQEGRGASTKAKREGAPLRKPGWKA